MPPVIRLISIHHCFAADPETLDIRNLAGLAHPGSLLEDFDFGTVDFDAMPNRPPSFVEGGCLMPFSDIVSQSSKETAGKHSFWLSCLKTSAIAVLAGVPEDQVEDFAKRWSTYFIYDYTPFGHVPKDISPDEAARINGEEVLRKIRAFLTFFCPFCRQALAVGNGIYVLWERHEYWREPNTC